ncbi:DUF4307 domain-containing protein [Lacisediminihabitans changchengi]|uniref:DUF4307 domain-containing protein n=1 Tax=Lacisediminihabitans changchengi TaxID=2787634 RepID=A0A934SL10_9MICO|nr:DUF4307 domain-containing protein [Lacisediminihabitans changchengi]MBK4347276.1 DUF4307 domain-containing protein [Lacisediminihabitans changchengi]
MTAAESQTAESSALAARYGRTPSKKRRDRLIYIVAGVAVAVVVSAWVIWAGLDQAGASLETQDVGNTIVGDSAVDVKFQLSMPIGNTAECALQAQNSDHAITGWKIVKIPASKTFTTGYEQRVLSAEPPVTGLIYRCWLT